MCCTAQPPHLYHSIPCRTKEHELQPACLLWTRYNSHYTLTDYRGAVIHLHHRLANLISPRSTLSFVARCSSAPRCASRFLLVTRISVQAPPGKFEIAVTVPPHACKPERAYFDDNNSTAICKFCSSCNVASDKYGVSPVSSCPRRVGSRQITASPCTPLLSR